jgi:hypothetical protein
MLCLQFGYLGSGKKGERKACRVSAVTVSLSVLLQVKNSLKVRREHPHLSSNPPNVVLQDNDNVVCSFPHWIATLDPFKSFAFVSAKRVHQYFDAVGFRFDRTLP